MTLRHGVLEPVCPDWAILKSSWEQIVFCKEPKYLSTFGATFNSVIFRGKMLWLLSGQLLEKLGNF